MATGVQLSKLVKDLRAECGHSLSVAQGQASEETLRYMLARQQEELYVGYDWPTLKIRRMIATQANERFYNYPAELPFENVRSFWCHTANGSDWTRVEKGIDPGLYASSDSLNGVTSWPPQRWDHNADRNQIELWPMPSMNNGEIVVEGYKPLAPLLNSDDVCTLDSLLIILFTSVEVLGKTAPQEAEVKSQKAQRHLMRVLGTQGSRKRAWTVTSGRGAHSQPVVGLDFIPRNYRY
jgi:hypothetical protein